MNNKKIKILVAVTQYAKPNSKSSHLFIETRNLFYKHKDIVIHVLNFSTKEDYIIDGIPVFSLKTYKNNRDIYEYDILVIHQSNIRNHYIFLKKFEKKFPKIVFFYHGHEVLKIHKVYSKPYPYVKNSKWWMNVLRNIYDSFKLHLWHAYLPTILHKSTLVFVSHWMYDEFIKWVKINPKYLKNHMAIIYNSIGQDFEVYDYDISTEKIYDFVTIRGNLDNSKYAIDIVNEFATHYPQYKFLIIGKGDFFKYNKKPINIEWRNTYLTHKEMIEILNMSKCALMPTRTDAQGLMMCEMATFGIPVITSDIPVCHEVLGEFKNVKFINNENILSNNLSDLFNVLQRDLPYEKNNKFFACHTCQNEVDLFNKITK